jgi:Tfp pilus assembly protein PilN
MINLLPYRQKKIITQVRTLRILTMTLAMICIVAIVASALLLPSFLTINSRYVLAQNQIAQLEKEGVVVSTVDIASLDDRTTELVQKLALAENIHPTTYVSLVQNLAGSDVTLTGYSFTRGEVSELSIGGVGKSREALQAFVAKLQASPEIESVNSPIANYVKSKDADFRITIIFKK